MRKGANLVSVRELTLKIMIFLILYEFSPFDHKIIPAVYTLFEDSVIALHVCFFTTTMQNTHDTCENNVKKEKNKNACNNYSL